ncbi:hypothetical protein ACHHYP_07990 [Achlya hypogyna]|uniref:SRR1-like domain-containing protein n=1 Tax=Achlya hypogyna TaxID=1202772 RepID=A0A1V9YQ96_ACHHY|nr:hypothetical protein ACHHYP_07990 [Achlya hypogyna]
MTDDWTFVGRKQKKSFKPKPAPAPETSTAKPLAFSYAQAPAKAKGAVDGVARAISRATRIRDAMRNSAFYARLKTVLDANLALDSGEVLQLVAYGVGSFASGPCGNAVYQLACTALLCEYFKHRARLSHAYIYDPVMTEDDNVVAEAVGLQVLPTNERGQRRATTRTLFFMPHCGKQLYQNVLLANWGQDGLAKIAVLGNSFEAYDDRVVQASARQASIFSALVPYTTEVSLGSCEKSDLDHFQYDAAFNDTSLHIFSIDRLETADADGLFLRDVKAFDVGTDEDLM